MTAAAPILVCPLAHVGSIAAERRPSAMVTLQSRPPAPPTPPGIRPQAHTTLLFHDVVPETHPSPDLVPPAPRHARAIVAAARQWDRRGPLLIHCQFGVSRSPAAALIAALALDPARDPHALARLLRERCPSATPNAMLIAHGDALLGLRGALVSAVAAIGRGRTTTEGEPFALEVRA